MYYYAMKKLSFLLLCLFTSSIAALEIQCQTNLDDVEAVIKKSEDTSITYLVLIQGNQVSPLPLFNESITISSNSFKYLDETVNINMNRDLGNGSIAITGNETLHLSNCKEY